MHSFNGSVYFSPLTIVCIRCLGRAKAGFPHEEGHVEGEGGQEADVEEHDDHQVPLPGHAGPHQILLELKVRYKAFY